MTGYHVHLPSAFFFWFYFNDYFFNYYESITNFVLNDFLVLYLNYYYILGLEFAIIAILLFFATLTAVIINFLYKKKNFKNDLYAVKTKSFFFFFLDFLFLRKQNLLKQNFYQPSLKIFKKK